MSNKPASLPSPNALASYLTDRAQRFIDECDEVVHEESPRAVIHAFQEAETAVSLAHERIAALAKALRHFDIETDTTTRTTVPT